MIASKTFTMKTKKGSIMKIVREHYLRDDISCGSELCSQCHESNPILEKQPKSHSDLVKEAHYIIPDTNVILHQMDILEDPVFQNVILLQTVLKEVAHRQSSSYYRLRKIWNNKDRHFYVFINEHHKDTFIEHDKGESINDRNDRAIRIASKWYKTHLCCSSVPINIVFLTNDKENLEKAKEEGLKAFSVKDYINCMKNRPDLMDKLAVLSEESVSKKIGSKDEIYPMHLTLQEIHSGIKSGKLHHGKFQAMRENSTKGYVFISDCEDETNYIIINGKKNINRAIHDDIVAVELISEEELISISDEKKDSMKNKPFGKIVGIIKRNWRAYSGILEQTRNINELKHIFIPLEKRIPKVKIETRQAKILMNKRIIVRIDNWPRNSIYPLGHYVEILGEIGDKETETKAILIEHDIPHQSFPQAVLECLPSLPWIITDKDIKSRTDLRNLEICSIDPPGCTDIDDALHCHQLSNGNYEVGVHIADVSHFIIPSTAIDDEAALRGNTVYLVDKRIDMVPELLSSNLCSLRANEDRFAFSCIWELDSEANIVKTSFLKSIIKSKAAFTYEEAQCIIDDKKNISNLAKSLRKLNVLAKILRKKRIDNGALTLASTEIKFSLDEETHDPISTVDKQFRETNSLVEEFMLLANISVARYIVENFPEFSLLRRHPIPPTGNFESLIKAGLAKDFIIEVEDGKKLAESLENCILPDNPYFNTMMRMKATRCMTQALYFCSGTLSEKEYFHYGLAVSIYTHFTSPIRRYADIIVHRLLAAALGVAATHPTLVNKKGLQELCNKLNYRHKKAQDAGRSSVNLYMHLLLKDKMIEENGYIFSVGEHSLIILLPKYGLETKLKLRTESKVSIFTYNEQEMSQTAEGITLKIFDPVTVQIFIDRSNIQRPYVHVQLVKPVIKGFSIPSISEASSPPPKKRRKR